MEKKIVIDIPLVLFYIGGIIAFAIIAWWVIGDSPTPDQISIALGFLGILIGYSGNNRLGKIEDNTQRILQRLG